MIKCYQNVRKNLLKMFYCEARNGMGTKIRVLVGKELG